MPALPRLSRLLRTACRLRPRRASARAGARVLALLAIAVVGPQALAAGNPAPRGEALTIAVARSPLSLPLYIAQERGYFADAGLDVRFEDCVGGYRCLRRVDEGEADVATCSEMPVVFDAFAGSGATVIGTMVTTSDDFKLVVRRELAGLAPAQLAQHRIGMVPGSGSQYYVDMLLMNLGIDPRAAQLVELAPEALLPALRAGRVDALAIWEPIAWQAMRASGLAAVPFPATANYIESFDLVVGPRTAGRRDAALARLLGAVDRAEQFIQEQPALAQAVLRQRLQLDRALVEWVWPGLAFRLTLDQSLLTTMDSELRWARREGRVSGTARPAALSLVHATPLQSIKPSAVGIGN